MFDSQITALALMPVSLVDVSANEHRMNTDMSGSKTMCGYIARLPYGRH